MVFCLIFVAIGLYTYYIIPKQENPDTSVAAAVITTVYPGATPEEVEINVTNILEEKIAELDSIDYYTSSSMNSASVVVIMYDMDVTIDMVEDDLIKAIDSVQSKLPSTAYESEVETDVVADNQFIISISGENYSDNEIKEYSKIVQSKISDVDGIESVTVDGIREQQVVVEADLDKLRTYGLSIENILQLMQAQNVSIPSGSIDYESGTINVNTPSVFESLVDIENTVVSGSTESLSFVKLKDVADVFIEDVGSYYYAQDGENAVLITGTIEDGLNSVNVGTELRKVIDEVKLSLPSDLLFHEVMYAPADIETSINDFILSLLQSIGLIIVVVMIGVHLRNGLVVSITLPLSILATFMVMYLLGMGFHFISIAALIVSLGILVDNSIVTSEAIQANINTGLDKTKAITNAVKTNAMPVLTSTLTTIVTFGIIYFVPGVVGQVAGEIPTVVIAALVASYFVAMLIIPVFAFMVFKPEPKKRVENRSLLKRFFVALLSFGLSHKKKTVALAFVTLAVSGLLASQLGLQFFPVADKPIVYIDVESENMSFSTTEQICEDINEVLDKEILIDNYTYAVGKGLPSFFLTVPHTAEADNVSQYMLQLNSLEIEKHGGVENCARYLQNLISSNIAGADITVKSLEYSIPTEARLTYSISGDDLDEIHRVTEELTEFLKNTDGTENVRNNIVVNQYEYNVGLDSEELSGYGLLKYDVVKQINTGLMGATASTYSADNNNMDIVVRCDINNLSDLENLQIVGSVANSKILLGQIADIQLVPTTPIISHYNGDYYVNVLSEVAPGGSSFNIENYVDENYLQTADLRDVDITTYGEVSNMMDLVVSLGISAVFAVFVIYVILFIQFKDYKKPLIILTSIPLSLIGCFSGLWILQMDIQAMAMLGLVSLFGIVVNNGILLIEAMDAHLANGESINEACRLGVEERFRPIVLSATTTCIGLVPLIVSGDSMSSPMATVLMFGLIFSTLLTMVVVPVLYSIDEEKKKKKARIAFHQTK